MTLQTAAVHRPVLSVQVLAVVVAVPLPGEDGWDTFTKRSGVLGGEDGGDRDGDTAGGGTTNAVGRLQRS